GLILSKASRAQAIDKSVFPGIQGGPFMHQIAAKAVGFGEALQPEFKRYQERVIENARVMGEVLQRGGVRLLGGGTDTHLLLVDLTPRGLTGKAVEEYLDQINITANKNAIPYDPQKPAVTSGLRLGTPAITSRGMGAEEARAIAAIIVEALDDIEAKAKQPALRARVGELTSRFDVP
ncbi:MAG: serine hydroxymethyltransferase, partial [Candidatus Eremiobacteraeota bacterium]|nr:serine hydroxymethyltransferase [Candidatus Eremiobacteraeota bacterium]